MADGPSGRSRRGQRAREALDPLAESRSSQPASSSSHVETMTKAIFSPFQRKKGESSRILTDLAPMLMTPKLMSAAASSSSRHRAPLASGMPTNRMDLVSLGRTPFRLGLNTRRMTSASLQIVEASEELLSKEIPEPEGLSGDVSLLRGFNATIPSSERNKTRRRQTRNVETPRMGLKRLGMNARGLLMEDEETSPSASEDDLVVVNNKRKGKRRARESLGASVALGKEELGRQTDEILIDKENIHVRRTLINSQITEITRKINQLTTTRSRLEQDLLKLQEDELELDDELEGVSERLEFEENVSGVQTRREIAYSSRRRKGPAFLPSEHDELPPGVAFLTFSSHRTPITALDFSEPYGTLVSASSSSTAAYGGSSTLDEDDPAPRVWDLLTASEIGRLRGHRGAVKVLQVEDHVCLTGGVDGAVRVWDLRRVGEEEDMVSVPEVSETDEGSVSLSEGGLSEESGAVESPCARVLEGHSKAVTALFFEENCLVTGASDKTLRQWDLTTGQCILTMDILWAISHPHPDSFLSQTANLDFSNTWDANALLTGGLGGTTDFVGGLQFWGYGLVSGSADGAVRMWDMRTGQAHRTLVGHTAPVTSIQFDELHIVSGSLDRTVRIWDLRMMNAADIIQYDGGITSLQFDSRKVVAAAGENAVKIYNRTTQQFSSLTTNGHTKPVERMRYMDKYLVSGGRDATVKVWAL